MKFTLNPLEMATVHGFYKMAAVHEQDPGVKKGLAMLAEHFNPTRSFVELSQPRLKIVLDMLDRTMVQLQLIDTKPLEEGAIVRLRVLSDTLKSTETKLKQGFKGDTHGS